MVGHIHSWETYRGKEPAARISKHVISGSLCWGSHIAQVGLELTIQPKLALNSWPPTQLAKGWDHRQALPSTRPKLKQAFLGQSLMVDHLPGMDKPVASIPNTVKITSMLGQESLLGTAKINDEGGVRVRMATVTIEAAFSSWFLLQE